MSEFLRYFDGVHRRTLRDVLALPEVANGWVPERGEGEAAWGVNQLIAHLCTTREMFVTAYRAEGWTTPANPDTSDWSAWPGLIQESGARVQAALAETPDEWMTRRVPAMEGEETVTGWRLLMLMIEHEIHHRSQIDTYAGLNGWEPPQIYGRRWEDVVTLLAPESAKG